MGNRIFVAVVVLLWVSTMSWLMVARILPPFFQGEPPHHGQPVRDEPVCWQIEYGGRPIGQAVSQAVPGALGTTEIHSRFAMSASCFFFALLGAAFSILQGKRQFLTSFFLCFMPILMIYYPVSLLMMNLCKTRTLDPIYAMWLGNALLLMAGVAVLRRVMRH